MTESFSNEYFQYVLPAIGTFKISFNDGYILNTYMGLIANNNANALYNMVAFEFIPVTEGHRYVGLGLAKDLKDYRYLYSLRDSSTASKIDVVIDNVIEITEEEYFKIK